MDKGEVPEAGIIAKMRINSKFQLNTDQYQKGIKLNINTDSSFFLANPLYFQKVFSILPFLIPHNYHYYLEKSPRFSI